MRRGYLAVAWIIFENFKIYFDRKTFAMAAGKFSKTTCAMAASKSATSWLQFKYGKEQLTLRLGEGNVWPHEVAAAKIENTTK